MADEKVNEKVWWKRALKKLDKDVDARGWWTVWMKMVDEKCLMKNVNERGW